MYFYISAHHTSLDHHHCICHMYGESSITIAGESTSSSESTDIVVTPTGFNSVH